MRGIFDDVQSAVRCILRQPMSSVAIVLTLALGIGATTATYAIFDYVLFRPTPGVGDTSRIVSIQFEKADNRRAISSGARAALSEMRNVSSLERPSVSCPAIAAGGPRESDPWTCGCPSARVRRRRLGTTSRIWEGSSAD